MVRQPATRCSSPNADGEIAAVGASTPTRSILNYVSPRPSLHGSQQGPARRHGGWARPRRSTLESSADGTPVLPRRRLGGSRPARATSVHARLPDAEAAGLGGKAALAILPRTKASSMAARRILTPPAPSQGTTSMHEHVVRGAYASAPRPGDLPNCAEPARRVEADRRRPRVASEHRGQGIEVARLPAPLVVQRGDAAEHRGDCDGRSRTWQRCIRQVGRRAERHRPRFRSRTMP